MTSNDETVWENTGLNPKIIDAMRLADVENVEELYDSKIWIPILTGPPFKLTWGLANKVVNFVRQKNKEKA